MNTIQPGIESLSNGVLTIMRKGTTAMQNIQLLKWCKEIGIQVFWVLLYGLPGEDPADYRRMAVLIDQLTHLEPPQVIQAIRLDRFSPNFVSAKDLGFCNVRPDRSYGLIYDEDETDLSDLAYYFECDYVDGRRPLEYVAPTKQAVQRWLNQTAGQGLTYIDRGDELAVWDFRPVSQRRLNILNGCGPRSLPLLRQPPLRSCCRELHKGTRAAHRGGPRVTSPTRPRPTHVTGSMAGT